MKLLLLIAAFMFVVSAKPEDIDWAKYKEKYDKHYPQPDDIKRYEQYLKSKEEVKLHNQKFEKGETTYKMALNQFADWFKEEKDSLLANKLVQPDSGGKPYKPSTEPVPKSINWVKKGAVTSVKDQKHCGCGYAFSAAGALEGLMFVTQNKTANISAQEFLDCSKNSKCKGGYMTVCFDYVIEKNATHKSEDYPYVGEADQCKDVKGTVPVTANSYEVIKDEQNLTTAVGTVAPVSTFFALSYEFLFYDTGIYNGTCAENPNHGMLIVGYDTDNKTGLDYWLFKNSFGMKWGEKGFARIIRNKNWCKLADMASYPEIKK